MTGSVLDRVRETISGVVGKKEEKMVLDPVIKNKKLFELLREKAKALDGKYTKKESIQDKLIQQEQMSFMRRQLDRDRINVDVTYPVNPPFGFANITFDKRSGEMLYNVREPKLRDDEPELMRTIRSKMETTMDREEIPLTEESIIKQHSELSRYLRELFEEVIDLYDLKIHNRRKQVLFYHVEKDLLGWGRPDVLFRDPFIEDISCNGPRTPMFVFHRVFGSLRSNIFFDLDSDINKYVIRLAQIAGKHVSIYQPILDATLSDGSRINLTLGSEVTRKGSTFTVRKFSHDPISPVDLLNYGSVSAAQLAYFWLLIEKHRSLLISGGTASGKTTLLNALCMFIRPEDKIVSIEDTPEIHIDHVNWIQSVARIGFGTAGASGQKGGAITLYDLLAAALRQRPEFVIVGEVRGKEAFTLFQAISVGHAAMATIHAGSIEELLHRVENEPMNIPRVVFQALDVVVFQGQVMFNKKRVRRINTVVEILDVERTSQNLITNNVFSWDPRNDIFNFIGRSYHIENIAKQTGKTPDSLMEDLRHKERFLQLMQQKKINYYKDVNRFIGAYYTDPVSAMQELEALRK